MRTTGRLRRGAWLALLLAGVAWLHAAVARADALQFRIVEGRIENAFHQEGPVAAHLLLSSGAQPRLLVAFPAGNSGVGLWFEDSATPVRWTLESVEAAGGGDADRVLHGIRARARLEGGPLRLRDAVLGSVRVLRDYQLLGRYPPETAATPEVSTRRIAWRRDRLDGAPGYALELELEGGSFARGADGVLELRPDREGRPVQVRLTALTGETPLTPLAESELLNAGAGADRRSRDALRFLSYREKFLAGSWRFNTYFGRDTLMSLRLLLPVLQPEAAEAGLAAVLERLDANGEVAHEEDIGEFAVLRRREGDGGAAPLYDYGMVDDDYMLAPVAAAYLLDRADGRARAEAFLARRTSSGEPLGAALVRNFAFVLDSARAFARSPEPRHLVAIKPGRNTGQWRDSEEGLAHGRYAYDVNAVWVPAALEAIARLHAQGWLDAYADADQRRELAQAAERARVWAEHAPALFEVDIDVRTAREQVAAYAAAAGVDAEEALACLPDAPLRFPALALDGQFRPIPVLHSDVGFALLFTDPAPERLDAMVAAALRPFPAGLLTGIGMLVANPAYADAGVQAMFGRNAYHGTVVWSWQQALMAAGLQRQLARDDLPEPVRARLRDAQVRLWAAIDATAALRTSELWTWEYADGGYRMLPFGQGRADVDESNAAQLWSTVYLALPHP